MFLTLPPFKPLTYRNRRWIDSLLCLAYGNHFGLLWEYEFLRKIDKDEVLGYDEILPQIGAVIDDDTFMAMMCFCHTLTRLEDIYYESINKNYDSSNDEGRWSLRAQKLYGRWAMDYGVGIGYHTHMVLVEGSTNKDSEGNGFLMRNIPSIAYLANMEASTLGYNMECKKLKLSALELINEESNITHTGENIGKINKFILDLLTGKDVTDYEILDKLDNIETYNQKAWVFPSLKIALTALNWCMPFKDTLKRIVIEFKGDTDTNCAIYGALYGAMYGMPKDMHLDELHYFIPSFVRSRHRRGHIPDATACCDANWGMNRLNDFLNENSLH